MNAVRQNAYAKLNLTLDVTGTENGYHTLDSLMLTVDLCDKIVARKRKDAQVGVTMRGMGSESIPPEKNNALRAAEAFVSAFQTTGAEITVYKNIPVGAGMGGSSADAAGVLNALAKLYGVTDRTAIKTLADGLGSDEGFLTTGGLKRVRGRGEQVEETSLTPELWFLALCPRKGVSTAECFRKFDEMGGVGKSRTEHALGLLHSGNAEWAAKWFGNDLYEAAKSLEPEVEESYLALKGFSPWGVSLTGSGSASFAVFPTRELCEWAKSRYTGRARAYVLKSVYSTGKEVRTSPYTIDGEIE